MSLLGEEVVEEWLNRKGYFTIRGIKIGNSEIDILAIKPLGNGKHECRHIEVQLSFKPMGYFTTHKPKELSASELEEATRDWVEKKFGGEEAQLKMNLCDKEWTKEIVFGNLWRPQEEVPACKRAGLTIHWFYDIFEEMKGETKKRKKEKKTPIQSATGGDLFELMLAATDSSPSQRLAHGTIVAIERIGGSSESE